MTLFGTCERCLRWLGWTGVCAFAQTKLLLKWSSIQDERQWLLGISWSILGFWSVVNIAFTRTNNLGNLIHLRFALPWNSDDPFQAHINWIFRDIFMDMKASSPPFKCQSHSLQFSNPTRSLALATGRLHKHEGLPEVIYGELQQLLNFSHLKCGMFFWQLLRRVHAQYYQQGKKSFILS